MKNAFASCTVASLLAVSFAASASDAWEIAMGYYESGQYALAVPPLQAAALAGDPRAQEILGFMYAMGGGLYPGVPRDSDAAQHWFDLAARGGQPVGRYADCAMRRDGVRALPPVRVKCFDWMADTASPPAR